MAKTRPAQWVIHLGLEGCSQPRELWFSDILMYMHAMHVHACKYVHVLYMYIVYTCTVVHYAVAGLHFYASVLYTRNSMYMYMYIYIYMYMYMYIYIYMYMYVYCIQAKKQHVYEKMGAVHRANTVHVHVRVHMYSYMYSTILYPTQTVYTRYMYMYIVTVHCSYMLNVYSMVLYKLKLAWI